MLDEELENKEIKTNLRKTNLNITSGLNNDVEFKVTTTKHNTVEFKIEELQIPDSFDVLHSTPLTSRKKSLFSLPELSEISEASDDENKSRNANPRKSDVQQITLGMAGSKRAPGETNEKNGVFSFLKKKKSEPEKQKPVVDKQKVLEEEVTTMELLKYSDAWDKFLMVIGVIAALASAAIYPLMFLFFGQSASIFIDMTRNKYINSSMNTFENSSNATNKTNAW